MSLDLAHQEDEPIGSIDELVDFFRSAEQPRERHRLGIEHEKLLVYRSSGTAVPYEGPDGVGALLAALARGGHQEFREGPGLPVIALTRGQATISLEPGGQLELSGAPARTAREVHQENLRHLDEAKKVASGLGVSLVALGYRPFGAVAAMPWMPKTRYRLMRETLGARGPLALDMMLMTATGQVSLDWADEADCARKMTLAARITPLLVALYANSPLADGRPTGFESYRSHVWTGVDAARCGYLPAMLDGSFSYRAYVDWALEAPMLFLRRRGEYLRPRCTFGDFLRLGCQSERAMHADWVDHLSTLFPEVRIKRVLEIRGADSVSAPLTGALAALMRGLLYEPGALADAERLLPRLSFADHLGLHEQAQRHGLQGKLGHTPLSSLARELLAIAGKGLARLDREDLPVLEPLAELAATGHSPARGVLAAFEKNNDPAKLLAGFAL
ncbi:MAG: glutamate--cysteine ligase [Myxococcaceae bacterium]